ncbi:hypothetical protein TcWFU_006853 [Taenia crassiceps]|uniref:Uncharacterized protein n=1 Tax=Taenia crassiceps TaxID=6207 RepID=A0ABR4QAX2_9CEST
MSTPAPYAPCDTERLQSRLLLQSPAKPMSDENKTSSIYLVEVAHPHHRLHLQHFSRSQMLGNVNDFLAKASGLMMSSHCLYGDTVNRLMDRSIGRSISRSRSALQYVEEKSYLRHSFSERSHLKDRETAI